MPEMAFLNQWPFSLDPGVAVSIWMLVPGDEDFLDDKFRRGMGPSVAQAVRDGRLTIDSEILDYTKGNFAEEVDLIGGDWGKHKFATALTHGIAAGEFLLHVLNHALDPSLPIGVRKKLGSPRAARRALHKKSLSAETFETRVWPKFRSAAPLWASWTILNRDHRRDHNGEPLPWPIPQTALSDLFDFADQFRLAAEKWAPTKSDAPLLRSGEAWTPPVEFPRNPKMKIYLYQSNR